MKRKVLMVATTPSMIGQFNISNIKILQKMNYQVDIACNFKDRTVWTDYETESFLLKLEQLSIKYWQINFSRKIKNIGELVQSYKQLYQLVSEQNYKFIHSHTPIASVLSRIVCHKLHIPVIYTAHGFHFYKGSPVKNWLIFYPIEKFLSRYTDVLITINTEDFRLAQKRMKAKSVELIPSVGLDVSRFQNKTLSKESKREELQIPKSAIVLLSVGELSNRKNQRLAIEALGKMNNRQVYYLIVGTGALKDEYQRLINSLNMNDNIRLLGYRSDIVQLCKTSDIFVHTAIREGLGMAPLEAMASGLPLISSYINGIKDYTENGKTGYCINPYSLDEMIIALEKLINDEKLRLEIGNYNKHVVQKYDLKNVEEIMERIYRNMRA